MISAWDFYLPPESQKTYRACQVPPRHICPLPCAIKSRSSQQQSQIGRAMQKLPDSLRWSKRNLIRSCSQGSATKSKAPSCSISGVVFQSGNRFWKPAWARFNGQAKTQRIMQYNHHSIANGSNFQDPIRHRGGGRSFLYCWINWITCSFVKGYFQGYALIGIAAVFNVFCICLNQI